MNISAKTLSHYMGRSLAFLSLLLLVSCAMTNYEAYYSPNAIVQPYCKTEQVNYPKIHELDSPAEVQRWRAQGYEVYGTSSFCSLWTPRTNAIDVARKHGTPLVLVYSQFEKEEKRQETQMIPQVHYSYDHGNVYDNYGTAYNYSGHTTSTTYMPVTVSYTNRYYTQTAFFMAKRLFTNDYGVYFRKPVSIPGRQQPEKIVVDVVISGSKAEKDGVRIGDTVQSINGKAIDNFLEAENYMNGHEPIKSMVVSHE